VRGTESQGQRRHLALKRCREKHLGDEDVGWLERMTTRETESCYSDEPPYKDIHRQTSAVAGREGKRTKSPIRKTKKAVSAKTRSKTTRQGKSASTSRPRQGRRPRQEGDREREGEDDGRSNRSFPLHEKAARRGKAGFTRGKEKKRNSTQEEYRGPRPW